ncbi:probable protein phosphatase 2C 25 [Tanacetum coccineum]
MPGSVAITNSPVFLSSPMFRKPSISLHHAPPTPLSPSHLNGYKEGKAISCDSNTSPSSVLNKRKRPARIQIPFAPLSFVDEVAKKGDEVTDIDEEGEAYSVYCKRGKRRAMEDRFSAVVGLQGDSKQAFFGVFDGHGGAKAAEYSANNLNTNIMSEVANKCEDEIVDAVREGYLATDSEFMKEDVSGGTCAVTALIRKGNLIVSNVGDCRAVMSRGGVAEALTDDHKPSRKDEKDRIESLGGYVDCRNGVWRIQGSLAVSRAIGDKHLAKWVIAEPETRTIEIRPECEFLILASDGIWDTVSNQEAVDIVRPFCIRTKKPDLTSACKKLVSLSTTRGSYDDMSVMVIQLPHFLS